MSQLTLELPESLRVDLERQAVREGVSLQDYIVNSLTRFVAPDLVSQKIAFEEMTTRYPREQAETALQHVLSSRQTSS